MRTRVLKTFIGWECNKYAKVTLPYSAAVSAVWWTAYISPELPEIDSPLLFNRVMLLLKYACCPGQVVQLIGALVCAPKDHGFNSQSGHIPTLWIQSLFWAGMGCSWSMFLSLPSSLSKINKCILRRVLRKNEYTSCHLRRKRKTS